ncbi:competence protein ComA [Mannheimia varigena]|uniref:competence protein ComA n=1 Tax=Mannheimia varigena TaxID=85404 RepID=UPI001106ACB6|nr:competence protein ComA [Mannheimia varigena]TLU75263.1 competence protein ComA [Mannheimia varigena]
MKLLKPSVKKPQQPTILGLSEDEQYYCLVKNEAQKFHTFWQKKSNGIKISIQQFIEKVTANKPFVLVRTIPYQYIWRKTIFMSKNLDEAQLHQQVIQILKNEQPLAIELLNFDYQRLPSSNSNLNKIIIYAINKNYAKSLDQHNCILDCELHCYIRTIFYLNPQFNNKFPCFSFKQKIVHFTESELLFPQIEPEDCIYLSDLPFSDIDTPSDEAKQLYFLAFGASLWNGKVLI